MQIRPAFMALVVTLAMQGCATVRPTGTTVEVSVESRASPTASAGNTFVLMPGNKGITRDDAEFRKYASYLQRILATRGFVPASKSSEAGISIVLSYGIVDPKTRHEEQTPTWLQTRSSSGVTTGTVHSGDAVSPQTGNAASTSSYGMVGEASGDEQNTMYFRYAKIDAYDVSHHQNKPIWTTKAVSMGSSNDLQQIFPFLMAAAAPYLASTTDRTLFKNIRESDLTVK